MTALQPLRNRAGLIVSGAASFIAVVAGMRLVSGEPLVKPQTDVGIVVGVAMAALTFGINDMRRGAR